MKTKTLKAPGGALKPAHFRDFLLAHLNRVFCAKTHLYEKLPEFASQIEFPNLRNAVLDTWGNIGKQIARTEEIYVLLDEEPCSPDADELIEFLKSGFNPANGKMASPDLSILFYLSIIESVELATLELLQMAAADTADQRIKRLLKENFEESKTERTLFLQITAIYVS